MPEIRESVAGRRIPVPLAEGSKTQPGDFAWDFDAPEILGGKREDEVHFLYVHLPGQSDWGAIRVKRGAPGGDRVWGWDGNEEMPTITPSIWHKGVWHGHMIQGQLRSD